MSQNVADSLVSTAIIMFSHLYKDCILGISEISINLLHRRKLFYISSYKKHICVCVFMDRYFIESKSKNCIESKFLCQACLASAMCDPFKLLIALANIWHLFEYR